MNLNPPKKITFYITIVLALLGLISQVFSIVQPAAFWLLLVAYILLGAGLLVKGL